MDGIGGGGAMEWIGDGVGRRGALGLEDGVGSERVGSSEDLRFSRGLGLVRSGYKAARPNIFVQAVVCPVANDSFAPASIGPERSRNIGVLILCCAVLNSLLKYRSRGGPEEPRCKK